MYKKKKDSSKKKKKGIQKEEEIVKKKKITAHSAIVQQRSTLVTTKFTVLKMSNREQTSSRGDPQNMAFLINAMQFECLNVVLGEFRNWLDRRDTVITNLQKGWHQKSLMLGGKRGVHPWLNLLKIN